MDKEIKNKYCDAFDSFKEIVSKPISVLDFLHILRNGVDQLYNRSDFHNKMHHTYINVLEVYLHQFNIQQIVPNEKFFDQMWKRLNKESEISRITTVGAHKLYSMGLQGNEIIRKLRKMKWFHSESKFFGRLKSRNIDGIKLEVESVFGDDSSKILSILQQSIKSYSAKTTMKVPRVTRQIINEYFYPKGIVKRKVLLEIIDKKYQRFFRLTKESQKAIKWYEKDGKAVEAIQVLVESNGSKNNEIIKTIHKVSNQKLLDYTKSEKIRHALGFLDDIGKNGFEQATEKDVKKFEERLVERGVKQVQDYLSHMASFYINIYAQGFVDDNPFIYTSLKMSGGAVRKDFIATGDMEKIIDLSTVDFKNKFDVRDRLIALLGYDLAVRIGEILLLDISSIKKDPDGEMYLNLRPGDQKGSNKDEEIMYFFFDETKKLLEVYLKEMRKQFKPIGDKLIVSDRGTALCYHQGNKRFRELCESLNIKTYYGKHPSTHVLRHSFATLNIEPLGLSLSLYEVSQRLRHEDVKTTKKHYIHNNPYLKKLKHNEIRKKSRKKTASDILSEISLAELEHWLSDILKIDSSVIELIRRKYKIAHANLEVDSSGENNTMVYIKEDECLSRLKHLEISARSLRQYAANEKILASGYEGSFRHGRGFKYKEDFIDDLVKNWVLVQEIQKRMKLPNMSFWRQAKKNNWRIVKIGKVSLVRKTDCL